MSSPSQSKPAFPLPEMLQHYAQSGRTGCFRIQNGPYEGKLYLTTGTIIHAETANETGESAAIQIISWKDSGYEWSDGEHPESTTMTLPAQELLVKSIVAQNQGTVPNAPDAEKGSLTPSSAKTRTILDPNSTRIVTLDISSNELKSFRFVIKNKQVTVGRDDTNELCLPDTSCSRKHAIVIHTNDTIMVKDLGSMNGTYIDGQIITEGIAKKGQIITFGEVHCKLNVSVIRKVPTMAPSS